MNLGHCVILDMHDLNTIKTLVDQICHDAKELNEFRTSYISMRLYSRAQELKTMLE